MNVIFIFVFKSGIWILMLCVFSDSTIEVDIVMGMVEEVYTETG